MSSCLKPPAPRACDRCWMLKTQCDSQSPCARCKRLQLPCLTERPLRARGRPSKATSSRQAARQHSSEIESSETGVVSSQSTPSTLPATATLSQGLPELPIDHRLIDSLLQRFISSSRKLGIFGALPSSIGLAAESYADSSLDQVLSPEVRSALLAIALETYHYRVPESTTEPRMMSQDLLRISAPALTPSLTWESDQMQTKNALLLALLSYTWCLSIEFVSIALRWHSVSCVVYEVCANTSTQSFDWDEFKNRTEMVIYMQDAILALLYNLRKTRCHFQLRTKSTVTDSVWHDPRGVILDLSDSRPFEDTSYFVLMHPLVNCMRAANEAPLFGSREWLAAKNQLSSYFFCFPQMLLRFDDLTYAYEAEAMIWMHGLFIILYGTRDLVDLIMDPIYLEANRFSYLLEHSLLLGDVLPTFLSLDPYLNSLSPATTFFILQSAAIHAMALHQFIFDSNSGPLLDTGVPDKLARSSDHHCDILSAMRLHCKRYNIPLIEELQSLLSYNLSRAAFRVPSTPPIAAQTLMQYRWSRGGTGIIPLQAEDAGKEWQYSTSPDEIIWQNQAQNLDDLKQTIVKICAPDMRICRNGYFDLSILIR